MQATTYSSFVPPGTRNPPAKKFEFSHSKRLVIRSKLHVVVAVVTKTANNKKGDVIMLEGVAMVTTPDEET